MREFIGLNRIKSVVDVGCGDYYVMQQVMKDCPDVDYTGVDVVEELIQWNNERFIENHKVNFICADAGSDDEVPAGDLLIVRQVLQHLSNEAIFHVLGRLPQYKYAIITEHITAEKLCKKFNIDKEINDSIRAMNGSGVYLDKPPFSLQHIAHVLAHEGKDGTVIRTSLICR